MERLRTAFEDAGAVARFLSLSLSLTVFSLLQNPHKQLSACRGRSTARTSSVGRGPTETNPPCARRGPGCGAPRQHPSQRRRLTALAAPSSQKSGEPPEREEARGGRRTKTTRPKRLTVLEVVGGIRCNSQHALRVSFFLGANCKGWLGVCTFGSSA